MLGQRIKKARSEKDVTGWQIEKTTGISRQLISNVEAGRRSLSDEMILKLAPILGVPAEELKALKVLDSVGTDTVRTAYELSELKPIGRPDGFYRFPCLGTVAAGALTVPDDWQDSPPYYEFFGIEQYDPQMFCLQIQGDSMEPEFKHGGVILVIETTEFKQNGLYVVQTENHETTFKVFEVTGRGAKLKPLNPAYEPISTHDKTIVKAYRVIEYKKSYL